MMVPQIPFASFLFMQGRAVAAHLAHNQEVAGSSPAPATSSRQAPLSLTLAVAGDSENTVAGILLPSVLRIGESHVVHPFKRCGFKSRNRNQHKRGDHVWHQSRPFVVNRHFRARLARLFSGFNRLVSGGNHRRFTAHQQKTPRRPGAQHEPRPGLSYCRGIRPRPAAGNVWRTTACTSLHRRCWRSKRKGAAWQV